MTTVTFSPKSEQKKFVIILIKESLSLLRKRGYWGAKPPYNLIFVGDFVPTPLTGVFAPTLWVKDK